MCPPSLPFPLSPTSATCLQSSPMDLFGKAGGWERGKIRRPPSEGVGRVAFLPMTSALPGLAGWSRGHQADRAETTRKRSRTSLSCGRRRFLRFCRSCKDRRVADRPYLPPPDADALLLLILLPSHPPHLHRIQQHVFLSEHPVPQRRRHPAQHRYSLSVPSPDAFVREGSGPRQERNARSGRHVDLDGASYPSCSGRDADGD